MRKIHEVLRLKYDHQLAERKIAVACGIVRSTVQDILKRHRDADLGWPLPAALDDVALIARLYPPAVRAVAAPLPDFAVMMQTELTKKAPTLTLLWQDYKATHPDGLQYSAFCERFAMFRQSQDVVMRQCYRPGDLSPSRTSRTSGADVGVRSCNHTRFEFALIAWLIVA